MKDLHKSLKSEQFVDFEKQTDIPRKEMIRLISCPAVVVKSKQDIY